MVHRNVGNFAEGSIVVVRITFFTGIILICCNDSNITNALSLLMAKKQNKNKNKLDVDIVCLRRYFTSNVIQPFVFMRV
jgi:hypothetical protein